MAAGWPLGRHWRPAFLNSPTSSFFLVSTLITGSRSALVGSGLLADVAELGVPVRVLLPLDGLGVGLQAEPLGPQQAADRVGGDRVALGGQLGRQAAGRLRRPPQRRHRVAPLIRLHQGQQRREQPRVQVSGPLAAPARTPDPAQRPRTGIQLVDSQRHRALADPGSPCHQPDPAMAQRPGLRAHQQPPLPLIQMREDHRELRRQDLPRLLHAAHTTAACRKHGTYGLFSGKPLAYFDHAASCGFAGLASLMVGGPW